MRHLIRSSTAGVFVGEIVDRKDNEITLKNVRRIWYWDGASSLSELAMKGVSRPQNCKFPCVVPTMKIFDVSEILEMTEEACKSIDSVPVWTQF